MTRRDKLLTEINLLKQAHTAARATGNKQRVSVAKSHLMRAQARLREYDLMYPEEMRHVS